MPENRRLSPDTLKNVTDLLNKKCDKRYVQNELSHKNIDISIKDLHNINARVNKVTNGNNLKETEQFLIEKGKKFFCSRIKFLSKFFFKNNFILNFYLMFFIFSLNRCNKSRSS